MWTCSSCQENHTSEFDICWKCGTDQKGEADPNFDIESPNDVAAGVPTDIWDPATRRMPDISYYSAPMLALLCPFVVMQWPVVPTNPQFAPHSTQELIGLAIHVAGAILIGLPFVIALLRLGFYSMLRNQPAPKDSSAQQFLLLFLRLPDHIRLARPWFVPVYNWSFVLYLLGPVFALVWLIWVR